MLQIFMKVKFYYSFNKKKKKQKSPRVLYEKHSLLWSGSKGTFSQPGKYE